MDDLQREDLGPFGKTVFPGYPAWEPLDGDSVFWRESSFLRKKGRALHIDQVSLVSRWEDGTLQSAGLTGDEALPFRNKPTFR